LLGNLQQFGNLPGNFYRKFGSLSVNILEFACRSIFPEILEFASRESDWGAKWKLQCLVQTDLFPMSKETENALTVLYGPVRHCGMVIKSRETYMH